MQKQLIAKGFNIPAGATGYYGDQTVAAVKKFYTSLDKKKDGSIMQPDGWKDLWS
jgi:peptidoglycan hydrolase-like protein with peptidoglycan-binding domain